MEFLHRLNGYYQTLHVLQTNGTPMELSVP